MNELKMFAALRPDDQLSETDLAEVFAEVFAVEQSTRLAELGVVAEPDDAGELESAVTHRSGGGTGRGRRRGVLVAVAAAVVAAVGVGGLLMVAGREPGPQLDSASPRPASPIPAASAPPASPALMEISPLAGLVEPFVPEGFTVLYASGPPTTVVAYNEQGVRLEVTVDLDQAGTVRDQIGDGLVETAEGQMTKDGTMLLSTGGDLIRATFSFAGCPCELDILDEFLPLAAQIVTGIAGALDEKERVALRDFRPPLMGTSELRAAVAALLDTRSDMNFTGERVVGPWDFNVTVGDTAEPDAASTLAVEAIRAEGARLDNGAVQTSERTAVATLWINGWQLVAGSITPGVEPAAVNTSQLEALLADVAALFADWTNSVPTDSGCATHQVVMGDSLDSIAERYGTTSEALATVNADVEAAWNLGNQIEIPCPATPAMPSNDQTGLESFQHSVTPPDFEPFNTIRFATNGFVYVVSGGSYIQGGSVLTERFSRDTATSTRVEQAQIPDCGGAIEVVGPVVDPTAIEIRCTSDGQNSTLDVFTSQTQPFED